MRQEKLSIFGSFSPTGIDQSKQATINALRGLSNQVGSLALEKVSKIRTKQGEKQGRESIIKNEDGSFESVKLQDDGTIFGKSFNDSAILASRAQIIIDTKESLDRIQNDNKLDPESFKASAKSFRKELLSGMPEELAVIVARDFDNSASSRLSRINSDFFAFETDKNKGIFREGIETASDDLSNAARSGDDDRVKEILINNNAMIDQAVESRLLSSTEAGAIKERALETVTQQKALKQVDSIIFNKELTLEEQAKKGVAFLESLRTSDLKDLDAQQKDALINVVKSKIGNVFSQIKSQENESNLETERVISNLKIESNLAIEKAKNGEITDLSPLVEKTEELFNKRAIPESARTSIGTKLAKAANEIESIALADKRIIAKLSGDNSILVSQSDLDRFYKLRLKDEIDSQPKELAIAAKAQLISDLRQVPTEIRNQIKSDILSNDPAVMKGVVELVDRLDEIPGISDEMLDPNQREFINTSVRLSENMLPEQAIKIARELTDPRDKARIEERKRFIEESDIRDTYQETVEGAFNEFFGGDLDNNINLQKITGEYKDLVESFIIAGTDPSDAREIAVKKLKANWQDSQFGFMKYPPETYYNVDGNVEYIKEQLIEDLNFNTIGPEKATEGNVFLISDKSTAREASLGQPTYRMMMLDTLGQISFPTLIDENGNETNRWMPDVQKQLLKKSSRLEDKVIEARK